MADLRDDEDRIIEAWRPWLTLNQDMQLACMRLASGMTRVAVEATVSLGEHWLDTCRHQLEAALADAARAGEDDGAGPIKTAPIAAAEPGDGARVAERSSVVVPRQARAGNGVRAPARAGNGAA